MTTTLIKKIFFISVCILSNWLFSPVAYAAQLSFAAQPTIPAVGEEFTITVYLDTQKDLLNGIEGAVLIPKELVIEKINTGGSDLSLWPVEPHFYPKNSAIEFFGGIPGGLSSYTNTTLFSITAKANVSGTYTFNIGSANGYINDGKGTRIPIDNVSYSISVATGASISTQVKMKDITPPHFVAVEVGSDPVLFEGLQYLTFFATDDQSGVSYYEVKEGWFGHYTRANRYYILSDQTRNSPLWVRVVDASGNDTVKMIISRDQYYIYMLLCFIWSILIIVGIVVLYRNWRRNNDIHI